MKYLISMQYRNKDQTTKFHFNSFIFIWRLIKFSYSSVLKLGLLKNFKQKNFDSIASTYLHQPLLNTLYTYIYRRKYCANSVCETLHASFLSLSTIPILNTHDFSVLDLNLFFPHPLF